MSENAKVKPQPAQAGGDAVETKDACAFQESWSIYKRMCYASPEINVNKNLTVEIFGGKSYQAISADDVMNAVRPIERRYGIYSFPFAREIIHDETWETTNTKGNVTRTRHVRLKVTYRFINVDRPEEFIEIVSYGDGIDTGDKALGKAMTYADKYALLKAYKIADGEDLDKTASPMSPEEEQRFTEEQVRDIVGQAVQKAVSRPANMPARSEMVKFVMDNYENPLQICAFYGAKYPVRSLDDLADRDLFTVYQKKVRAMGILSVQPSSDADAADEAAKDASVADQGDGAASAAAADVADGAEAHMETRETRAGKGRSSGRSAAKGGAKTDKAADAATADAGDAADAASTAAGDPLTDAPGTEDALPGMQGDLPELPVLDAAPQPPTREEMIAFVKANYDAKNKKALLTYYQAKSFEELKDQDLAVAYNRKRKAMGLGG